ncbi:MAG: NADPH:quinone oxidoreductase family protein [Bryobacterales bacterium]|nr:NADPH:quinone oxidoreductase family protein [Bryobacterales bacterium]
MRAWQVTHYGEPEEMTLAEVGPRPPAAGEVRIRNRACGLNFFDLLQCQGKYQSKPAFPFTIGAEVAGVVDAVGPGVEGIRVGDRVLAVPRRGGFADSTFVRESQAYPIPAGMSFAQAAAMPVVFQTSLFALQCRAQLRAGEWLLVHAGASGVGSAAIQLGTAMGAHVIATAGSERKLAFCKRHGAKHALNYRDGGWVEQVRRITGKCGADVIYDPVGGDVFDLSTKVIAPGGRLLVVGFTSGRIPSLAANRALLKNMSLVGVFWGRHCDEHPGYMRSLHDQLAEMFRAGAIDPPVSATYPLEAVPQGIRDLANRKVIGKAVVKLD